MGLGKRLTDYGADKHVATEDDTIDENYGVAVVITEEEEEVRIIDRRMEGGNITSNIETSLIRL